MKCLIVFFVCAFAVSLGAEELERRQFTEKDLPEEEKGPGISEIEEFTRSRGFNYARTARQAARGDARALKQFFAISKDVDGAAAESHTGVPTVVYHLLGDAKFARFLSAQPLAYRMMVRNSIAGDDAYLRRHFPETTKVFFQRELIDWVSPDKKYAIRKVFSDEFAARESKVERAEVIEQASGRVVGDMTTDDIGRGANREGEVLWSRDSKRFAYLSSDLTQHEGNPFDTPPPPPHRKQTTVYQLAGDMFVRLDLNFTAVPGREADKELNGAALGHEHVEPVRWEKPTVLILQRHEYYQKLKPLKVGDATFDTVHSFDRLYRITATIKPDGTATLDWKQRDDR